METRHNQELELKRLLKLMKPISDKFLKLGWTK
jgi:hypothetical protein